MILRQINAEALADAQALHMEQTCSLFQACSLSAAAQPATPTGAAGAGPSIQPCAQLASRQASLTLDGRLLIQPCTASMYGLVVHDVQLICSA